MPWSEVYFVGAFAAYVGTHSAHFERRAGTSQVDFAPHAGTERFLLGVMGVGAVGLPATYILTSGLAAFDYRLPPAVTGFGALVSFLALWLFWRAHVDLGRNWSRTMGLKADQRLVTHGVYRHVRHPMYAAIWLFGLGQGCLLHNVMAGLSALVAFAPMYAFRVSREERMMRERFGDAYVAYTCTTGRLWPRGRTAAQPE